MSIKNWSRFHCDCKNRIHQRGWVEGSIYNEDTRVAVEETRCCACGAIFRNSHPIPKETENE